MEGRTAKKKHIDGTRKRREMEKTERKARIKYQRESLGDGSRGEGIHDCPHPPLFVCLQ